MKRFTLLLVLFLAFGMFSCGSKSPTEDDESDLPEYEVYVLMSASWASQENGGLYRFISIDSDEIKAKVKEALGDSDKLLVPGHDMEVFRRFPKVTDRIVQIRLN